MVLSNSTSDVAGFIADSCLLPVATVSNVDGASIRHYATEKADCSSEVWQAPRLISMEFKWNAKGKIAPRHNSCLDEIMRTYPDHVVLDSEAVRHLGIRAKPLHESTQLQPKRLYFLVEWPKVKGINNTNRAPTRVRSKISMTAKSRLESMLLASRSVSDISIIGASNGSRAGLYPSLTNSPSAHPNQTGAEDGAVRLKIRLTKAQLSKFMAESQDGSETAEKILDAYLTNAESQPEAEGADAVPHSGSMPWKPALRSVQETNCRSL